MRPISKNFFGPSGIKCVFAINDAGDTRVGYIIKQIGLKRYRVTDGTVTKTCTLASAQPANLTHLNPGECVILVSSPTGSTDPVTRLDTFKCVTSGGDAFSWKLNSSTADSSAQLIVPYLPPQTLTAPPMISGGKVAHAEACSDDGTIVVGYLTVVAFIMQ